MTRCDLTSVPVRVHAVAAAAALTLWALATALLVAVGDRVVPPVDTDGARVTWPVAALASAAAGWATARVVVVATRHVAHPSVAALVTGIAIAAVGLTADTILVGSLGGGYPNMSDARAHTIVIGLLVGHAAAMLGAIAAGQGAAARRTPIGPATATGTPERSRV